MPSVKDCTLPAIYAEHFNGGTRLVNAHDAPRHAVARFELASTLLDDDGVASQPARLLTPLHLIVLSQVLALLRHANTHEAAVIAENDRSIAIAFRARYLMQRAGLVKGQFYGAAYDRLEKILSDLAMLRIKYSEREEGGEWKYRSYAGFFEIFTSGGARDVFRGQRAPSPCMGAVSYTHLTLPTICSV